MAKPDLYPILIGPLREEDGGGYLAIAPDLPGCMSDGSSRAEALTNVQQAILEWIDAASVAGKAIPEPNNAQTRALHQKRALEEKIKEQARSLVSLEAEVKSLRVDLETFGSWHLSALPRNHKDAEDCVH